MVSGLARVMEKTTNWQIFETLKYLAGVREKMLFPKTINLSYY
jgi:hypothetical protein